MSDTHPAPRPMRGLSPEGAAIWSYGFRPFFLGGAVQAVLAMALWIAALALGLPLGGDYGAALWHAHEMLFGFAPAVLAGFLLTAIPNWTGSLPVSGRPLIGLFGLWLLGRGAMLAAGWLDVRVVAALDLVFLPALLGIAGREIVAGAKWKDLKVLAGVAAVLAGNAGFHAAVLTGGDVAPWLRAAVAGYVLLVLIIGGRIIPSFTRNWLSQRGTAVLPVAFNRGDGGVIAVSALALLCWVIVPEARLTVAAAGLAAGLNLWRLGRWCGASVRGEWLLLVLHLAYGFVPLGFGALVVTGLGWLPAASALHVLTIGVIGTMMLAVMTRATRGHTGRPLTAARVTVAAYLAVIAAALARPLADVTGVPGLMTAAGLLWMLGFALFVVEHAGMLLRVRRRPQPRPGA